MDRSEYRRRKAEYRAAAKKRHTDLRARRAERQDLPRAERRALAAQDRAEIKDWKAEVKAATPRRERKAQKKGYKTFRRLRTRWYRLGAAALVVLLVATPFVAWYRTATTPMTQAQESTREASLAVAGQVQAGGSVLLANDDGALPLGEGAAVSLFGAGSVTPVYGGGGAGGISTVGVESLYQGFVDAGLDVDESVRNVYGNWSDTGEASTEPWSEPEAGLVDTLLPALGGFLVTSPDEMPPSELPDDVLTGAREHSEVAVYVLSRAGMEGNDFTPEDLRLSEPEQATVELLDETFESVVVLVNSTNAMELSFLEEHENVDAALWIGGPGETGASAVAEILTGVVNPSGRLTDTWAYDIESHPAVANTGDFQYVDADGADTGRYFTNHTEGIYAGYRYFETFVPDAEYDDVVQFPFGYGLSYTDFSWELTSSSADDETVTAEVEVTNTGDVPGRDVVQLYYSAPYTPGGIEKPATVLGGYAKTGELAPGASETVRIELDTADMASYDDTDEQAWVLDAGTYELSVARDVHDVVDTFSHDVDERRVIDTDPATGHEIANRFPGVDGGLTYLSREDPQGTMPTAPEGDDYLLPDGLLEADYQHEVDPALPEPTTGAENGIMLADLADADMDDPRWEEFLDQFTADELVSLAGDGGYWSIGIDRLGIPATTMHDGPAAIRSFLGAWSTVAYPTPVVLASTWDDALAREVGTAMGAEAQAYGVDAAYAPSLDLHRSPLSGRNFEYFSEDPLLTGRIGAEYVAGMQSQGTVAVIKHFAGNVQETNRAAMGLYVWADEQTWREMHLRPFEAAVKDGGAHGAMSAFNRIGATWAGGDSGLLTDVLRDEWGFEGFVITDAGIVGQGDHFDPLQAAEAGNDMMLAFLVNAPGKNGFEKQLDEYLEQDRAGTLTALRQAAHHICFSVLQTNQI